MNENLLKIYERNQHHYILSWSGQRLDVTRTLFLVKAGSCGSVEHVNLTIYIVNRLMHLYFRGFVVKNVNDREDFML